MFNEASFETIGFWVFSFISVFCAAMMISKKNALHAAIWLIGCFLATAGIFITLQATFVAAIQIMVYAGAITTLIIFVIMLLDSKENEIPEEHPFGYLSAALVLAGTLLFFLVFWRVERNVPFPPPDPDRILGSTKEIGNILFSTYVFPFELASLLLLAGIIGAVLIGKRSL